ncbi:MAG TPA: hypothetical protein VMY88_03700 [Acidimicrobiales bacterium]|nr:hypothetical protein [Acidimicrobiales bacterium]
MRVLAFVPDLIDRSRITNVVEDAEFADSIDGLVAASAGADIVLVDLSRAGVLDALGRLECHRIVGFTNHTDKAGMEGARAAGAVPMARSDFFIGLEELLLGPR